MRVQSGGDSDAPDTDASDTPTPETPARKGTLTGMSLQLLDWLGVS